MYSYPIQNFTGHCFSQKSTFFFVADWGGNILTLVTKGQDVQQRGRLKAHEIKKKIVKKYFRQQQRQSINK